jgi:hypothetical protein
MGIKRKAMNSLQIKIERERARTSSSCQMSEHEINASGTSFFIKNVVGDICGEMLQVVVINEPRQHVKRRGVDKSPVFPASAYILMAITCMIILVYTILISVYVVVVKPLWGLSITNNILVRNPTFLPSLRPWVTRQDVPNVLLGHSHIGTTF